MSDIDAEWREKRRWRHLKPRPILHVGPKLPEAPIEEPSQDLSADIAALRRRLRCAIAALKADLKFRRLLQAIKACDPSQPRDDHGRWTAGGGASAKPEPTVGSAGIGHNQGPPLEEPPAIPKERPPTTQARMQSSKLRLGTFCVCRLASLAGLPARSRLPSRQPLGWTAIGRASRAIRTHRKPWRSYNGMSQTRGGDMIFTTSWSRRRPRGKAFPIPRFMDRITLCHSYFEALGDQRVVRKAE